jgi:translocation and assembly module TamB
LGGRRLADLRGNLAPDWKKVNLIVAESIEPNARVKGLPRPFHVRGPLSGGSTAAILKGLDAEMGVDLTASMAFGMLVGPTPIVLKCGGGRVEIVPISTTLNGGKVRSSPTSCWTKPGADAPDRPAGSAIEKAEINDEVSTRVLSTSPRSLHKATQVRGFVSVHVDRAESRSGEAGDRKPNVDGKITFHDVLYGPGTLAKQLLTMTGKGEKLGLRLNQRSRSPSPTVA